MVPLSSHPLTLGEKLADGKAKQLFRHPSDPHQVVAIFKDQLTAFNAQKVSQLAGKGALNARISARLFSVLQAAGLPTCFVEATDQPNTLIYQALQMIPLEVIVRNQAYGSIIKRLGFLTQGQAFGQPWVEYCYKNDALGDPPVPTVLIDQQADWLPHGVTTAQMTRLALAVNEVLRATFEQVGIEVADFKLEFGVNPQGELQVADELSPDTFRLRDQATGQVLDKDVFRLDLGDVGEAYQTVWQRLETLNPSQVNQWLTATKSYEAIVRVHCRTNVLHPESRTILQAFHSLGHDQVTTVEAGKRFRLVVSASHQAEAESLVRQLAETILSNPVIEGFEIDSLSALSSGTPRS